MSEYIVPKEEEKELLRRRYVDDALSRELIEADDVSGASTSITPSELYAIASGTRELDARTATVLRRQPALHALYCRMLRAKSTFFLGEALAASAGPIERVASGCRIRTTESQAESSQVYVIIEFDEAKPDVGALVIVGKDGSIYEYVLPEIRRGVCQFIADTDGELPSLLNEPKSVVHLR